MSKSDFENVCFRDTGKTTEIMYFKIIRTEKMFDTKVASPTTIVLNFNLNILSKRVVQEAKAKILQTKLS